MYQSTFTPKKKNSYGRSTIKWNKKKSNRYSSAHTKCITVQTKFKENNQKEKNCNNET